MGQQTQQFLSPRTTTSGSAMPKKKATPLTHGGFGFEAPVVAEREDSLASFGSPRSAEQSVKDKEAIARCREIRGRTPPQPPHSAAVAACGGR